MIFQILKNINGYFRKPQRILRQGKKIIKKIHNRINIYNSYSQEQLQEMTQILKNKLLNGISLDQILVEAFSVVVVGTMKVLNKKHFDSQLLGGFVLHQGMIAEMYTGEGKTLTSILPAYLNALKGKGVHIVTVNDYLAKRDADSMGAVFRYLGMTVGLIQGDLNPNQRRIQYSKDITYVTNHELGFDYLRDNMVRSIEEKVINNYFYAIIDEADSILIDEARTPLLISGHGSKSSDLYKKLNIFVKELNKEHIEYNEFKTNVYLTEKGMDYLNIILKDMGIVDPEHNVYQPKYLNIIHYINQLLKAHFTMARDIDYLVSNEGSIIIIDKSTGRLAQGRRFSNGLHQALEAKENVEVKDENITLANITYQNFFKLYEKLSGMTGTAKDEEEEFAEVYNLEISQIPPNKPRQRQDKPDILFFESKNRWNYLIEKVKYYHKRKQPILIISLNVQDSEYCSKRLNESKLNHFLLNAKNPEQEAQIIRNGGMLGSIIVSTDMAGRGTDIELGGSLNRALDNGHEQNLNKEQLFLITERFKQQQKIVADLGGLVVLCVGRHDTSRLDNQAAGRCGRQGEPGIVYFIMDMKDELFQNTLSSGLVQQWSLNKIMESEESIEGGIVQTLVKNIQNSRALSYYEGRKHLFKYDKAIHEQRKLLYQIRNNVLTFENFDSFVVDIFNSVTQYLENLFDNKGVSYDDILTYVKTIFNITNNESIDEYTKIVPNTENILEQTIGRYGEICHKNINIIQDEWQEYIRNILVDNIDKTIQQLINNIDQLKDGADLVSYGQKEPTQVFKERLLLIFQEALWDMKQSIIKAICFKENAENDESNINFFAEKLRDRIKSDGNADKDFVQVENLIKSLNPEESNKLREELDNYFAEVNSKDMDILKKQYDDYINIKKKDQGVDQSQDTTINQKDIIVEEKIIDPSDINTINDSDLSD